MGRSHKTTDKPSKAQMQKALANISMYLRDNNRKEATLWAQTLVGYLQTMGLTPSPTDCTCTITTANFGTMKLPRSAQPLGTTSEPAAPTGRASTLPKWKIEQPSISTAQPEKAENHSYNERGIHA